MMSIVLSKSEMVENKEAENRALSRQLEQMQLQLKKAESTWKKVLSNLLQLSPLLQASLNIRVSL